MNARTVQALGIEKSLVAMYASWVEHLVVEWWNGRQNLGYGSDCEPAWSLLIRCLGVGKGGLLQPKIGRTWLVRLRSCNRCDWLLPGVLWSYNLWCCWIVILLQRSPKYQINFNSSGVLLIFYSSDDVTYQVDLIATGSTVGTVFFGLVIFFINVPFFPLRYFACFDCTEIGHIQKRIMLFCCKVPNKETHNQHHWCHYFRSSGLLQLDRKDCIRVYTCHHFLLRIESTISTHTPHSHLSSQK